MIFRQNEVPFITLLPVKKKPIVIHAGQVPVEFIVQTLEGDMRGKPGDYLMKGVKGEYYVCDKEIFEQSYESAWQQA